MISHADCTCCRHWRAVEQPSADEGAISYALAQELSPETVSMLSAAGRCVRVLPPRLPARRT